LLPSLDLALNTLRSLATSVIDIGDRPLAAVPNDSFTRQMTRQMPTASKEGCCLRQSWSKRCGGV
jgi:hypothetical protein